MSQTHFDGPVASGYKFGSAGANPSVGLAVLAQQQVVQANGAAVITANFYLPPGSQILEIIADTVVAWTATTASLTAGIVAGGPQYIAALDVKAVGRPAVVPTGAALLAMNNIGTNTLVAVTITSTGPTIIGTTGVTITYIQKG
jgi:hypothetical protein